MHSSTSLTTGQTCRQCSAAFTVSALEQGFLRNHDLPLPADCPVCRRQKRLPFRNFFNLHHRTCSLTGKKVIAMYDSLVPFPVYDTHEWWSDRWDPLSFGKPWNDERTFLKQMGDLHVSVPRMAVMNSASENTDYCNLCFNSRNCYLVHGCVNSEDCMYGHIVWRSKNCFDCLYLYECEWCCECVDCVKCYSLRFSRDCDNCSDSMFLVHCIGCSNCFGCVGLKNKQYHIFNQPHSREEYEVKIQDLSTGSHAVIAMAMARVHELTGKEIVKSYHGFGCENVTGDYLYNCRGIAEGYDLKRCEDCAHLATCEGFKDCMDCNFSGTPAEQSYQSLTIEGYGLIGCHTCLQANTNLLHCDNCFACTECIGCVGLRNKQHCILNVQYTEEEYRRRKPLMIERMKTEGLWGNFFPVVLSPFGYNETIAHHYFPLTETQAKKNGWNWRNEKDDPLQQYMGPEHAVPDAIEQVGDDITKKIFRCEVTDTLFKILPQELAFYRLMRIPLPRRCFEQRHKDRIARRNPRQLWERTCAKCSKPITTTYQPSRPETVYCETCCLETVY
jgi:hypothetical protein